MIRGTGRWRWLGGVAAMALLLSRPRAASLGAAQAMARWCATVAPAVFPFMALMPLLTYAEACRAYERLLGRVTRALFGQPGASASAMVVAMVAGSPAGTIAARRVAAGSGMNRGQLRRLALSMPGFSPAFLVGGVGAAMLGSEALGWRLLASQALTQCTLALVLRRAWGDMDEPVTEPPGTDDQPMRAAVVAVLGIGGYMALFGAAACALAGWLGRGAADALLCLMDVPSGASLVAALPMGEAQRLVLLAGMCGFGGACVAAQNLAALRGCGIRAREYVAARVFAAAIGAGYMALLCGPGRRAFLSLKYVRGSAYPVAALIATLLALPPILRALVHGLKKPAFNK